MDHLTQPDQTPSNAASEHRAFSWRALLLLNAALLIVLAAVTFSASSEATQRARGDYTMAAGDVRGTNAGAVYIVDSRNHEMVVVGYNISEHRLDGIAYRNLRRDIEAVRGDRSPRR